MDRLAIKFSHRYHKLGIVPPETAKLIQVLEVERKNLSKEFLKYDTAHGLDEHFKLGGGQFLLLIFLHGTHSIFTTLRKCDSEATHKEYLAYVGEEFPVVVPKDEAYLGEIEEE